MKIERMPALCVLALLAACGSRNDGAGDQAEADADTHADAEAPTAEVAASDPKKDWIEACTIRMTAPEAREWTTYWDPRGKRSLGQGPSWAQSTYWANEEERKSLADTKAPPLEIQCSAETEDGEMDVAAQLATYTLGEPEVPFGPGTYPIVPRSQEQGAPKGFWAWPLMYGNTGMFEATGGSLTITRFDDKGIAGSFVIDGKEQVTGNRSLHLEAKFDMPCRGSILESKCAANKRIDD